MADAYRSKEVLNVLIDLGWKNNLSKELFGDQLSIKLIL